MRAASPALASLTPVNVEIHSPFLVRALDAQLLGFGSLAQQAERRGPDRAESRNGDFQ